MSLPVLRFKQDDGRDFPEWNVEAIGSALAIGSGKDYKHLSNGDIPVYGTGGYMLSVNDYLYDGESVCIGRKGTIDRPTLLNGKFWTVDTLFYTHSFKNCLPKFIYATFQRIDWKNYNEASGVPSLSKSTIEKIEIQLPSLPEQTKIANFLTAVDEKITQLTQKHDLLTQYKKGVMQQIFSQELRFKDDDRGDFPEWKNKKLQDVVQKFIVPMRDKPKDLTGSIPWCRIEDFVGKNLYLSKSGQGVSETVVKSMNLKIYPVNTLLVSCSANLGVCAIVKNELITNQTFIGLVPNHGMLNIDFFYYLMGLNSKRLNTLSSGTTISYLSREQFESFVVKLPPLKEQTKIANFLTAIDDKITSAQTQLKAVKQYKQGLLQQMFV